ncbi:MAG: dihydrofolate reductase [Clostridiales bacterium]|jgi:dihydrofolate reductase|nr:dihydrofolate reductase [Clostridiales bacterium]
MKLIAAVDKNKGIGANNALLYRIPDDMKFFREKTLGKVVVCGHNTLKSFKDGKPLQGRTNIVLSRGGKPIDGAVVCSSLDELLKKLAEYPTDDIYVIGGQTVYDLLIDYCDTACITEIDAISYADKFLTKLYASPSWSLAEESDIKEYDDIKYRFCTYKNGFVTPR